MFVINTVLNFFSFCRGFVVKLIKAVVCYILCVLAEIRIIPPPPLMMRCWAGCWAKWLRTIGFPLIMRSLCPQTRSPLRNTNVNHHTPNFIFYFVALFCFNRSVQSALKTAHCYVFLFRMASRYLEFLRIVIERMTYIWFYNLV